MNATLVTLMLAALAAFAADIVDAAEPETPEAIGTFEACDPNGHCESSETRFATMPGCVVGMQPVAAEWLGQHPNFRLQRFWECRPAAQQRA